MERNSRKIISWLLIVVLLCALIPSAAFAAEGDITLTAVADKTTASPGNIISITVSVENNPGIGESLQRVEYDPLVFEFVELVRGDILPDPCTLEFDYFEPGILYVWGEDVAIAGDGSLYTISFRVLETAVDGKYTVSFVCENDDINYTTYFLDEEYIDFLIVNSPEVEIDIGGGGSIQKLLPPTLPNTAENATDTTITLATPAASSLESAASLNYRISLDGGESYGDWQESPTFTGLNIDTSYSFQAKYVALDTAAFSDSDASTAVSIKTRTQMYEVLIASTIENGVVTADVNRAGPGDTVTLEVTPDEGYLLKPGSLKYTPEGGSAVALSAVPYTFIMPGADVEISAEFKEISYRVINTADELFAFAADVNAGNDCYGVTVSLGGDIDLENREWVAIGANDAAPFSGIFDGKGYSISGFSITKCPLGVETGVGTGKYLAYAGLFGYTRNATITDITIKGIIDITDLTGIEISAAPIVSQAFSSTVSNCISYVDITVSGSAPIANVSGIFFGFDSITTDCVNYGALSNYGSSYGSVTGIGGQTIERCINYGDIFSGLGSAVSGIGGLVVKNCANHGDIVTAAHAAGGIATSNDSRAIIENCYNTGNITSSGPTTAANTNTAYVGGITYGSDHITITNCYNIGNLVSTTGAATFDIARPGYNSVRTNCPTERIEITVTTLGDAYKEDINNVNGGFPILQFENGEPITGTFSARFSTNVSSGVTIELYSDEEMTLSVAAESDGSYRLPVGQYYFIASAAGYVTESGTFSIKYSDKTVPVTLREAANVSFNIAPVGANIDLTDANGDTVAPVSAANGRYSYLLYAGIKYTYTVTADGYNGTTNELVASDGYAQDITLTSSDYGKPQTGDDGLANPYIFGSNNPGEPSTIDKGGIYYIGTGASGVITINTEALVTLVGKGVSLNAMYEDLYIRYTGVNANLKLKDVFISNTSPSGATNLIRFAPNSSNTLFFEGTNILDMNTGDTGYASIHVPVGVSLTLTGGVNDSMYLYKREMGAGIGGNGQVTGGGSAGLDAEYNGNITIDGGNLFMKSSKQGALIGSGSNAGRTAGKPGDIIINGGNINLIAIARGAAIGGSAGAGGAAEGANVYINGGKVTINVDFSGAAIGGGGYDGGIDSDGGTLHYGGGSIRTYIDTNAVPSWSRLGVTKAGVNGNVGITADVVIGNKPAYLLILNTSAVKSGAPYRVVVDGAAQTYSEGLHNYCYINESLEKGSQIDIAYTMDNWAALNDPNLYLYLTGEDHTLTVNGETFKATWDGDNESFTVTDVEGNVILSGSEGGSTTATPDASVEVEAETKVSGGTATTSVTEDAVKESIDAAKEQNVGTLVIRTVTDGSNVDKTVVELPKTSASEIAGAGLSLIVETPNGSATLSAETLKELAGLSGGSTIEIIFEENEDGSTAIDIRVNGNSIGALKKPLKVTLPVPDALRVPLASGVGDFTGTLSPHLAVVCVNGDSETIIQKSMVINFVAHFLLNGPTTVAIIDNRQGFGDVKSGEIGRAHV